MTVFALAGQPIIPRFFPNQASPCPLALSGLTPPRGPFLCAYISLCVNFAL